MEKKRLTIYKICSRLLTGQLLFIAVALLLSFTAQSQTMLVAVGNVAGVPSGMKFTELKSVLMGEKQRWKNGNRIIIALMKTNTAAGKSTSTRIYDMTGDELNKFWLALVFQGKAQAPNFFNSVNELETFVAQNPGAIGILDKPAADAEIKPIMIDGKSTF